MNFRKVPHTIVRNGIYYLNIRISNKKFIRQSLLTDSARQAKILVSKMLPSIIKLKNQMELTDEQMDYAKLQSFNIAMRYVVRHARELANSAMYPTSDIGMRFLDEANDFLDDLEQEDAHLYEENELKSYVESECYNQSVKMALIWLSSNDDVPEDKAYQAVNRILKPTDYGYHNAVHVLTYIFSMQQKIAIDIEEHEYPKANEKLDILDAYVEKLIGDDCEFSQNIYKPKSVKAITSIQSEPSLSLKEAFAQFIKSKLTGKKRWTEKLLESNKRYADTLVALIGDKSIKEITGHMLDDAFAIALQMPKRNKLPYKNLTITDCIEYAQNGDVDDNDIIAIKTVREFRKILQGLFSFLKIKRIVNKSPTDDMLLKLQNQTRRGVFTHLQMRSIIAHALTQTESHKKWPLLIMAYTGMRNGEIMQLRKQDIKFDNDTGIHYFHINPDAGAVKTKAAIRSIPVHSRLREYGLLEFISHSDDNLFEKNARALTSYYSRLRKELALPECDEHGDALALYSIRHRVVTTLQSNSVNQAITQQLVGHSLKGTITGRYTHNIDLDSLANAIEKIQY